MDKSWCLYLALVILVSPIFVLAESFEYGGSGDSIELEESFGDILPIISASEMTLLGSSVIITDYGSTTQSQYIRFGSASDALQPPKVRYIQSEEGGVGSFIEILGGSSTTEAFFEYGSVFDNGLESTISTSNNLQDIEDSNIKLFADEYIIIDTNIDTTTSQLTLLLATSAISDTVLEGESKTYTIGLNKYEVTATTISASPQSINLVVNGIEIGRMEENEYYQLADDTVIGVRDIVTSTGDVKDLANIFLGAKTIEFEDTYNDNNFEQGFSTDGSNVPEGFVLLKGTYASDVFTLTDIKYRGTNPSKVYIPEGSTLSSSISERESLLGNWDISFNGFKSVSESQIKFESTDQATYYITFENQNQKTYKIPLFNKNGATGDGIRRTHFKEDASSTTFKLAVDNYFVLSTGSSINDKTFALQYNSINVNSKEVTFNEMLESGISQITATYTDSLTSGTLGEGTIGVSGYQFNFYIGDSDGNNLSIDLDQSGSVASDVVSIVANGGAVISFPSQTVLIVEVTTAATSFEESTSDETISFTFSSDGSKVGLPVGSFSNIEINGEGDTYSGMSDYGAKYVISDVVSSSSKGDLVIDYPQSQRYADVSIKLLQTSSELTSKEESQSTCSDGIQNGDESGLDCGGSCDSCEAGNCSDGIQNGDESGLDCGGSCKNLCLEDEFGELSEETDSTNLGSTQCPFGCLFTDSEDKTVCLKVGEVIEKKYCSAPKYLTNQKRNGETCSFLTECLSNTCEDNKCGLATGNIAPAFNILLILLSIFIIFRVHSLIKVGKSD